MFNFIRRIFHIPNKPPEKKGYWFDDPYLSYIKGYTEIDNAIRDGIRLHNEVDTIHLSITPLDDENTFFIEHPNTEVAKYFHRYFLEGYHGFNEHIYGENYSFSNFLQNITYCLITDGQAFYAIDWEEMKIKDRIFILPKFRYLKTSTMHVKGQGERRKYIQKYSLLFWIFNKDSNRERYCRKFIFNPHEVFYLRYHFFKKSPTKQCLKYIPRLERFWEGGILYSKAVAHPEDFSLPVEKVRYQNSQER